MHRCSKAFHPGLYRSVPCLPYQPVLPSAAHSCCSHIDYPEILPDVHCCSPSYRYESPTCYDCLPRVHHRHHARPPIVQTNIQNEFCYYLDEPEEIYDDAYGHPYRLSRSKVQLVDIAPKHRPQRHGNSMVVSTYQPRERQPSERVMLPRSTVVRHTSVPSHDRPRRRKLVPLYHSAEPNYLVSRRHASPVRELIPVATFASSSNSKPAQTIRVRSMSPLD